MISVEWKTAISHCGGGNVTRTQRPRGLERDSQSPQRDLRELCEV